MNEPTVYCPVKESQINGTYCLEICIVADREANPSLLYDGAPDDSVLPPSIAWSEELRQKCLNCKWHAEVK